MSDELPSPPRVLIPPDVTPSPLRLVGVGVLALGLGFGIARLSLASRRAAMPAQGEALASAPAEPHAAGDQRSSRQVAPGGDLRENERPSVPVEGASGTDDSDHGGGAEDVAAEQDVDTASVDEPEAPEDEVDGEGDDEGEDEEQTSEDSSAASEPTSAAAGSGELQTRPGRIAYLRCEAPPCARDFDLERDLARVVEQAAPCVGRAGAGDVRVRVRGGDVVDVRFRPYGDDALEPIDLHRCIDRRAMELTGSTLDDGAHLSYRFEYVRSSDTVEN